MTMEHADAWPLLHDLVDGELTAGSEERVRAHLEGCDACAAEVEWLLSLRTRTRDLPKGIAPPRDLWEGIATRLEPRGVAPVEEPGVIPISRAVRAERPRWQRWGVLAAAATVIMAVSSAVTVQLLQDPAIPPVAVGGDAMVPAGGQAERPLTSLAAFEPTEQEYLATMAELERAFEERRDMLSPLTVAVVEENLRIIDAAIAEIRQALLADSTSVELPLLLSGVYRSRVDLLESTLRLYSRT